MRAAAAASESAPSVDAEIPVDCLSGVVVVGFYLVVLGAGGLAGSIYCGRILVQVIVQHRFNVDLTDRLFYVLLPLLGYLLALLAAVLLLMHSTASANVTAAALLTLLAAGIRNAWDMMVWIVIKAPSGGGSSP